MKSIDELIEEELNKFFGVVKERFYSELEKGIKNVSTGITTLITEDKKSGDRFEFRDTTDVYEFKQCSYCKKYHFETEKHACERGKTNA
ncbi:hypothetical protein [Leptospira weilii]|uniref:Uncharacterized protein n=1 Tax=Leptospira weilii str. UI 13098 TaxID=1088542 RepID=M6Q540_9LEPT|nr:hypothetical protein [Leptospira weilii]EMN90394.1 hypothetical protein LEP1GSC108_2818 [Leptospira weilii str. UI 13098]